MATVDHDSYPLADRRSAKFMAKFFVKSLIGTGFLLAGLIMIMTLWLIPLGVPLSLVGVALMMTAVDSPVWP